VAAAPPVAEPSTPAATGYPSLRTVPPRPRLTYPVEQRREIVEGLISDRENARYTDQQVRYRTGRSDVPPAAPRAVSAAEIDAVVGPAAPVVAEGPSPIDEEEFATVRRSGLGGADLDDDSLGDFIREMVRETRPGGRDELDLEPLPPPARAAGPAPQPGVVEPENAPSAAAEPGGGLLDWLGGLVSGRAAASEEAAATAEEVGQEEEEELPASAPAQEPEVEPGSEPSGVPPAATAPSPRKPGFVERPPAPPPVKPEPDSSGSRLEEVSSPS
jgi:hypothetical protein